jgi:hypothetical protein
MATYRVKQDLFAYAPARWSGTDYEWRFGARNEGFTLEADDLDHARALLRSGEAGYRLNPGLLTITLEAAAQLDLTGQPNAIPPDPAPPVAPGPPPVQLGLEVDVPRAIRLPRGQGTAYQHTLPSGEE